MASVRMAVGGSLGCSVQSWPGCFVLGKAGVGVSSPLRGRRRDSIQPETGRGTHHLRGQVEQGPSFLWVLSPEGCELSVLCALFWVCLPGVGDVYL